MKPSFAAVFLVFAGGLAAPAFDYNYNTSGKIQHWNFNPADSTVSTNVLNTNTHALRFYIAADAFSTTNTANERNAVRSAFGQWQSVPGTVIKFEEAGLVPAGRDINVNDNTNLVYWAKTSTRVNGNLDDISGLLGACFTLYSLSNTLKQFDIVLNGVEQDWFTDFDDVYNTNAFFVEGELCHEIGHALGVRHAPMGGATMSYIGYPGMDSLVGLSGDDAAFARALYSSGNSLTNLAHLKGTVTTKSGVKVLGAVVVVEGATNGNLAGATLTLTNGTYTLNALPPGNYNVRVVPLDPASATDYLLRGADISTVFASANTSFQPTTNSAVTLTAGVTNTLNFAVAATSPAFRITYICLWRDETDPRGISFGPMPVSLSPGQSDLAIGVYSANLPASNATFTVTGDGLTLEQTYYTSYSGLNGLYTWITVASNATPGLRSFLVQQGTNRAYANGYLEILPLVADYNFDGLDDAFQRNYFSPFTSTNAAPLADPDHDGMSNSQEYAAGTNPTNATSLLKISSVKRATNGATVTWQSVTNRHYQVLSRTNTSAGAWQTVGGVVTPTSTTSQLFDSAGTNNRRFYRVQALP